MVNSVVAVEGEEGGDCRQKTLILGLAQIPALRAQWQTEEAAGLAGNLASHTLQPRPASKTRVHTATPCSVSRPGNSASVSLPETEEPQPSAPPISSFQRTAVTQAAQLSGESSGCSVQKGGGWRKVVVLAISDSGSHSFPKSILRL